MRLEAAHAFSHDLFCQRNFQLAADNMEDSRALDTDTRHKGSSKQDLLSYPA
jgi:hypothetical protein